MPLDRSANSPTASPPAPATRRAFIGVAACAIGTIAAVRASEASFVTAPPPLPSERLSTCSARSCRKRGSRSASRSAIGGKARRRGLDRSGEVPRRPRRAAGVGRTCVLFRFEGADRVHAGHFPPSPRPPVAVGLTNKAAFNTSSPIATVFIPAFASTGGWTLGDNPGHVYFDSVEATPLTPRQDGMVLAAAKATYRPCCNNSTFFQDCNHGSALLGLMQIAASQGAAISDIYQIALMADS